MVQNLERFFKMFLVIKRFLSKSIRITHFQQSESAKLLTLLILLAADLNYPKPKINSSGLSLKSKPRNPEIHRTCILDLNQSLGNLLPKFGDSVLN